MGAAASLSWHKVRKVLLIRAYNARSEDETIREQFAKYRRAHQREEPYFLTVSDVKAALKVETESPWLDNLLRRFELDRVGDIDYESFIAFLEEGTEPRLRKDFEQLLVGHGCIPPEPPLCSVRRSDCCRRPANHVDLPTVEYKCDVKETDALVKHKGTTLDLPHNAKAFRRPRPPHPLWRKRETLIQERIVEYTTIDVDGTVQELVEREKSQTEILHMECKETGEFAHRETTEYEQYEKFNGEIVAEETGTEEYVHLKSVDDEYEVMESTMPRRASPVPPTREGPLAGDDDAPDGVLPDGEGPLVHDGETVVQEDGEAGMAVEQGDAQSPSAAAPSGPFMCPPDLMEAAKHDPELRHWLEQQALKRRGGRVEEGREGQEGEGEQLGDSMSLGEGRTLQGSEGMADDDEDEQDEESDPHQLSPPRYVEGNVGVGGGPLQPPRWKFADGPSEYVMGDAWQQA